MAKYVLCPRCELNYILEEEEYCDVCKAQMKGQKLMFAIDDEDEGEELVVCPVCGKNMIRPEEKMCKQCADEIEFKKDQIDIDKDEEWKNFIDEDEPEEEEESEEMISLNKLQEEEGEGLMDEEEEEEFEMVEDEPDDFDIPDIDESDFEEDDEESNLIRVAVVGKPNAGKSSLINRILGEERVIVSDIPGTTRDAIDTYVTKDGQDFCFIDTAGMRKRGKITDNIERYSIMRSLTAVDRSDVVVIMVDAKDGVTEQDTKIAGYAHNKGKACIVAINKWDLIDKETNTMDDYKKTVQDKLSFMLYAPVVFISALTGQRVTKLYEMIKFVADQAAQRISTGMLNDVLNEAVAMVQPPSDKGKRLKLYYMTQIKVKPPTFAVFVNRADLAHFSYMRYIENRIRQNFGFEGTPIVFKIREKDSTDV